MKIFGNMVVGTCYYVAKNCVILVQWPIHLAQVRGTWFPGNQIKRD